MSGSFIPHHLKESRGTKNEQSKVTDHKFRELNVLMIFAFEFIPFFNHSILIIHSFIRSLISPCDLLLSSNSTAVHKFVHLVVSENTLPSMCLPFPRILPAAANRRAR